MAERQLQALYASQSVFRTAVALLPARYPLHAGQPNTVVLRRAWQDAALGPNHIVRVHLGSVVPRYPASGSSSFRRHDAQLA